MPAKPAVDVEEFAVLARRGWQTGQLMEHFGCSDATVARWRKRLGIPSPTHAHMREYERREMTPERKQAIERMLDDGWSFTEISRTEGVARKTLRAHFPGRAWADEQRREFISATRRIDTERILHKGW